MITEEELEVFVNELLEEQVEKDELHTEDI